MLEAPASTSIVAFRTFLKDMLEESEKYRWHDLRKDPDDSPKESGYYFCYGTWLSGREQYETAYYDGECEWDIVYNFNLIAWREIEPFEEE